MVLILGTIVQESHTSLPIYPHSSYVLDPIPSLKGVQIKEGSLQSGFHTLEASIWGLFMVLLVARGVWAPFVDAIPSFPFNCFFPWKSLQAGNVDEMFQAATVVAAFLICLGIYCSLCQTNHKLLCYPFNSAELSLS